MIRTAAVHIWLPDSPAPVVAGEFTHESAGPVGRFRYDAAYLTARHPALAPDLPLRSRPCAVTGGHGIFPLFMDAGPDAWGRHLLARRLERDVSEIEALMLCPTDGVGNIALGEITPERQRVLTIAEFLAILVGLDAGGQAKSDREEQVLDAARNGTSLGGTKPKLTVSRDGVQYLAKFPEQGDSRWLPHIECAMLKLGDACGIRVCRDPEVWRLPGGRAALLVRRFDRETTPAGVLRKGYVSAHALLRLDLAAPVPAETRQYATVGFTSRGLRKSYVSLSEGMARWCGGQETHREERRELWRRIVFNALIRNLDDHTRNHGLLCECMARQRWRLSPAFDLVPAAALPQHPALSMAYRYVPGSRRGRQPSPPRLVNVIDVGDLVAAGVDHYGYSFEEAHGALQQIAIIITDQWRKTMSAEGVPREEIRRFETTFSFAAALAK
jgi:serine/threonine-protein kinase HipA